MSIRENKHLKSDESIHTSQRSNKQLNSARNAIIQRDVLDGDGRPNGSNLELYSALLKFKKIVNDTTTPPEYKEFANNELMFMDAAVKMLNSTQPGVKRFTVGYSRDISGILKLADVLKSIHVDRVAKQTIEDAMTSGGAESDAIGKIWAGMPDRHEALAIKSTFPEAKGAAPGII
jgi:hypothetical protein